MLVQRAVCDEEFLHQKINKEDVYVDYGVAEKIPEGLLFNHIFYCRLLLLFMWIMVLQK